MHVLRFNQQLPVYSLEPDDVAGNKNFRVYNFEGSLPDHSDLLIPHRKDHYLIAFIRRAGGTRQWVDMASYAIQDNTIYFIGPDDVIVKEGSQKLWSTGIAFTKEFLSFQESASLSNLPLIQNLQGGHELILAEADIKFVEDVLAKINAEYENPGEWQQRMLTAHLTVLLIYLSRLYTEQYKDKIFQPTSCCLKNFRQK